MDDPYRALPVALQDLHDRSHHRSRSRNHRHGRQRRKLRRTGSNDDYNNAEYEVAWLISGEEHYKKVRVGPPPSAFRNNGAPKGFGSLKWNGEIELTPHFLIEALDSNGNLKQMLNTNGMWIKARATTVYGVAGTQKRGVLPIIFKRVLGARNPVN